MQPTFEILVGGFLAGTNPNEDELLKRSNGDDEALRSRIAALRNHLEGLVFLLPDGKPRVFEIPNGRPYRLKESSTVWLHLLWQAHLAHSEDIRIHTFERLFFRHKTNTYIRDVKINHAEEVSRVAEILHCSNAALAPSMHYVSSGELRGAVALQNFFLDVFCASRARSNRPIARLSSSSAHLLEEEPNLILLGAPRVDAHELHQERYEKYVVFDGGVRPKFHDRTADARDRTVYVLMSRRRGRGGAVRTVLESSHGRAIQGVCEGLVAGKDSLCQEVMKGLCPNGSPSPPERFQVVFKVLLIAEDRTFVSRAHSIEPVSFQAYS